MENQVCGELDDLIPSIFSDGSNKIELEFEKPDEDPDCYLFESLLEILFKGIIYVYGNGFDINKFEAKHVMFLNKYLKKIGYKFMMDEMEENFENNHYCKIILSQLDEMFFISHNIKETYHFSVNPKYNKNTKLEDMYALLSTLTKKYHVSFYKVN